MEAYIPDGTPIPGDTVLSTIRVQIEGRDEIRGKTYVRGPGEGAGEIYDTFHIAWRARGRGGFYYANPDGSHYYSNCRDEQHLWPEGRGSGKMELVKLDEGPWVELGGEEWEEDGEPDLEEYDLAEWRIRNLAPTRRVGNTEEGRDWYWEQVMLLLDMEV
ncbi:hypothetical protein BJ508DRAFT_360728 [Ascobolus immersus RN42]|uniref:Uncharacterized protein n=1 Tax=Ascobolus immersus RN42 TaxID=1160509 RepID=A0A3N4IAD5_ASCIM|nr:hypothetical protein BJ508DRAFT_360728 [Ascobolus immersus RN42]